MLQRYLTSKQLHLQALAMPKRSARASGKMSRFVQQKMVKKHSSLSELENVREESSGRKGVSAVGMGDFGFMTSSGVKKDEMFVIVKSKTFEFPPEQPFRRRLKKTIIQNSPLQTVLQGQQRRKPTSTPEKRRYQHHKQLLMLEFEKRYREELEKKFLHRRLHLEKGLTATRLKML